MTKIIKGVKEQEDVEGRGRLGFEETWHIKE